MTVLRLRGNPLEALAVVQILLPSLLVHQHREVFLWCKVYILHRELRPNRQEAVDDIRQRRVDKEERQEVLVYILLVRLLQLQVLDGIRRCRGSRLFEQVLLKEGQLGAVGKQDGVRLRTYEALSQDDIRKIYKLDDRQTAYEQDDLVAVPEVSQEASLEAFREVFLLPFQELPLQKSLLGFLLGLALEQLPE
jgi:hypothetical protein